MWRKFPVLHRPSWLACAQILLLPRFERTPGVLLHSRLLLFERDLLRWRGVLAYQRRTICGRTRVRRSLILGRRRWRSIVRGVALIGGRW